MNNTRKGCPFLLLLRLLLEFVVSLANSKKLTLPVIFNPPYVHDLVTGHNATIQMTLNVDNKHRPHRKPFVPSIVLKTLDNEILSVVHVDKEWKYSDQNGISNSLQHYQKNFTVHGNFLGKTAVCVRLSLADNISDSYDYRYKELSSECQAVDDNIFNVWVIQQKGRIVNHIFLFTLVVLIIIANVLMGCELDLSLVLETLKKPIPPLIGLCTQFIAMPLLAYSIATVVFMTSGLHSFALGLFVNGCAPGGGASNYWTLLLDGDLPVSITMTFISTLTALVMMPAWMWALGSHFLQGQSSEFHIKVPYTKIISSLLTMIIPLMIGVALSRWKSAVRTRARKVMRPFLIFVVMFLVVFGAIANLYMFKLMTWRAVFGGLLLPWCGFTVGCFASLLTAQNPKIVTAIAVETGIQNTGIAIMLLKFSFPQPDADISSLIPVISACFTPLPLLLMVGVHEIIKRFKKQRQEPTFDAELKKRLSYEGCKVPPTEFIEKGNQKEMSI